LFPQSNYLVFPEFPQSQPIKTDPIQNIVLLQNRRWHVKINCRRILVYLFRLQLITQSVFIVYTAISIKVVPEQSGKVEYERERLAGNR
jgi:hypothetical protein